MSAISRPVGIEAIVEQLVDVARRRDVPPMLPGGGLHGRCTPSAGPAGCAQRPPRRAIGSATIDASSSRGRVTSAATPRPPARGSRCSARRRPGERSRAPTRAPRRRRPRRGGAARHRVRRIDRSQRQASTAVSRKNSGSFSAEIDQANRLGRNSSTIASPMRAGMRPKGGPDESIQQRRCRRDRTRSPSRCDAVRRGPDEHLHERQHVQIARRAVFVERVDQIGAVNRNAERDVAQPDRSLDEVFLVAEETAERHLRVVGQTGTSRPTAASRSDDRGDQEREQPAALVAVEAPHAQHRTSEPSRRANQTVNGDSA